MFRLMPVLFLVAIVTLAVISTSTIASATTAAPPAIGTYAVSSYVVSAVATNGGTCGAAAGDYLASYLSYPGPDKTGTVQRHSINGPQGNFIQELDFPVTPAAKVDTWSGSYTSTLLPGGNSQTSTFSTTFTFIDGNSFLGTTTYVYAAGQNSVCTTVFQSTYVRSGR